MVMTRAGLAFFLDVPHFTAGRDLAVAANHTSAVQCRESQKSHETHTYPLGGLVMASLVAFQPATLPSSSARRVPARATHLLKPIVGCAALACATNFVIDQKNIDASSEFWIGVLLIRDERERGATHAAARVRASEHEWFTSTVRRGFSKRTTQATFRFARGYWSAARRRTDILRTAVSFTRRRSPWIAYADQSHVQTEGHLFRRSGGIVLGIGGIPAGWVCHLH